MLPLLPMTLSLVSLGMSFLIIWLGYLQAFPDKRNVGLPRLYPTRRFLLKCVQHIDGIL
jgi:hypothetical protein